MTASTHPGPAPDGGARLRKLIELGIALTTERDHSRLLEAILLGAKSLANADAGTLYLADDKDGLRFEIMRTDSLNIALGGSTGKAITFPPLPLHDPESGEPNHNNIATHVALTGKSVNIPDAYEDENFDFSGTRKFDQGTGYRSKSFLTVPLRDHENQVIGVLQLLNALAPGTGEVVPFDDEIEPLIEALASQAAVAIDNQQLIEAQRRLLDAFIELLAGAIDAKSPYTGGHCQRVPELTKMLARAVCDSQDEPFADFDLDDDQWYELHIAAWLHDCGKVTTPEYVVDKATKLETIYNRVHEIRTRFEVVKRDVRIACLEALLAGDGDPEALKAERNAKLERLEDDFAFLAECNIGGELMSEDKIERLERIADIRWMRTIDDRAGLSLAEMRRLEGVPASPLPVEERMLSDKPEHIVARERPVSFLGDNPHGFDMPVPENAYNLGELYNLSVRRGTLTTEERFVINDHIIQTITQLEALPFPRQLAKVPEYAGGHHEKMDGTGYPRRLKRDQMSIPARIMAIADIFEALTAADRPYKKPKTLSESLRIMSNMKKSAHVDPDLFDLFLESGIYLDYAKTYLDPAQIDDINIADYM